MYPFLKIPGRNPGNFYPSLFATYIPDMSAGPKVGHKYFILPPLPYIVDMTAGPEIEAVPKRRSWLANSFVAGEVK